MLDAEDKTKNITFKLVDWSDAALFYNSTLTDPEGPDFTYKVTFYCCKVQISNYKKKLLG